MKAKLVGLGLGILITPASLFFATVSAVCGGAGHGDYLLARILFPLPMLSMRWNQCALRVAQVFALLERLPMPGKSPLLLWS